MKKHIEIKLGVLSLSLVLIGFFLPPIMAKLFPTTDKDLSEMVGFALMIAFFGLGLAVGVTSLVILHRRGN